MKRKLRKVASILGIVVAGVLLAEVNLPQDLAPNIPNQEPVTTEVTISLQEPNQVESARLLEG